jgi:hypothetical protein
MSVTNEKIWVKTVSARLENSLSSLGGEFKYCNIGTGHDFNGAVR